MADDKDLRKAMELRDRMRDLGPIRKTGWTDEAREAALEARRAHAKGKMQADQAAHANLSQKQLNEYKALNPSEQSRYAAKRSFGWTHGEAWDGAKEDEKRDNRNFGRLDPEQMDDQQLSDWKSHYSSKTKMSQADLNHYAGIKDEIGRRQGKAMVGGLEAPTSAGPKLPQMHVDGSVTDIPASAEKPHESKGKFGLGAASHPTNAQYRASHDFSTSDGRTQVQHNIMADGSHNIREYSIGPGGAGQTKPAKSFERLSNQQAQSILSNRYGVKSPADARLHAADVVSAKRAILEDMKSGTVPSDVKSFEELHDHVDANEYLNPGFKRPVTDHNIDRWNRVSEDVDNWLKSPHGSTPVDESHTIGTINRELAAREREGNAVNENLRPYSTEELERRRDEIHRGNRPEAYELGKSLEARDRLRDMGPIAKTGWTDEARAAAAEARRSGKNTAYGLTRGDKFTIGANTHEVDKITPAEGGMVFVHTKAGKIIDLIGNRAVPGLHDKKPSLRSVRRADPGLSSDGF